MRALGIDVSANRGLDLVTIDEGGAILSTHRRIEPPDLLAVVKAEAPDVVAIDAPPAWGRAGGSRMTERELLRFGIRAFGTPSDPEKADNAFYDWMRVGMAAFAAISRSFPRYRNGPVAGSAIEAFPHASAVVLGGCLPPHGAKKRAWRERILRAHGVEAGELRSLDQVDAALAALTGMFALQGRFTALGDPREGAIVIPTRTLPATMYRRAVAEGRGSDQLHLPGLTPCGCGDPNCTEVTRSEFAPGHDAKRKSFLWKQVRIGLIAADELSRRNWEPPPEARDL